MYKLLNTMSGACVLKTNDDGSISSIPMDEANQDFVQYQKWLSEGNQPLPADEPNA